jgi:hypothetical protein
MVLLKRKKPQRRCVNGTLDMTTTPNVPFIVPHRPDTPSRPAGHMTASSRKEDKVLPERNEPSGSA